MLIGIPREVKDGEKRVGLTPDKTDLIIQGGHRVIIESDAGLGAGFSNEEYEGVGAEIVSNHSGVYSQADVVIKVKEPQPEEFELLREGLVLFCYLHLAAEPAVTEALIRSKTTGIAYETVQRIDGSLPLLYPMSEIAGKLAAQVATRLMQSDFGGSGRLLGGVPGTEACRFIIVGGGTVGFNSGLIATGLGARVTIFDRDLIRLRYIEHITGGKIKGLFSTPGSLSKFLPRADVVVSSVLIPGAKAPRVVTEEMLENMKPDSLLIDVAIDQGGSVEGIKATTLADPTYRRGNVTMYAVTNIPGMVANTSSVSLANSTYDFLLDLANSGVENIVRGESPLARGVNTLNGHITHPAVANSLALECVSPAEAMA